MNSVAEEILSYLSDDEDNSLWHYGMPRRSGRYPWGSGDDPYQHSCDFLGRIDKLKKSGWSETPENIMKEFNMTTSQYRMEKAIAKNEKRGYDVARAKSLKSDGLGPTEIGKKMGIPESTVRSLLNETAETNMDKARKTADFIKSKVDEKGMIDVGVGVERELGISREKLNQSLYLLEREGYPIYKGGIPQATNRGKQTNQMVICPPGTEHKAIYDYANVHSLNEYVSRDGGETFDKYTFPKSMDSNRIKIRYAEEGGLEKDGIVEIRRGVDDLSLGNSRYAQVRILVDGTHYIKGMAVYSDDMPDGVDVVFNTNKHPDKSKMEVLKKIKDDPDNPFGALIKAGGQSYYIDANGDKQLSLINKTREEGDWTEWADALPSQFLSKQSLFMAKKQLGLAAADKEAEFDEICSLTNPTVKKYMLQEFADKCDRAAVDLKAAALPGQKYHVIIPINSLSDNEVYAPGYPNGTKLALVRYPHGGTFEIPILTVNNKNELGNKVIGPQSIDAVGINKNIADRLSGADFDGDTVMCIPTHDKGGKVKVRSKPPLKGLEGFDPKDAYPEVPGMKLMTNTQTQMGVISNLITDMTLFGASDDEIAAAVRHSMVVIDAEKHKLNYKQSEIDNNISALKKKYQSHVDENGNVHTGGASTLISRAKGQQSVLKRQGSSYINTPGKPWYDPNRPEGSLIYKTADDVEYQISKTNKKTGEKTVVTKQRMQKSTKMAETDDARTLVSEAATPMELAYADYANRMKALANTARKELMATGKIEYSASAKETYKKEVDSINIKLNNALLNATRERQAQRMANATVAEKKAEDPNMSKSAIKKASQQALTKYRASVGGVSRRDRSIVLTDMEWEAIQAGAISENKLWQILANADTDRLRELATPRSKKDLSPAKINRIKALSASNYSISEIANKLGVSTSTINKYLKGGD